jgi:Flp pilus assembly protein TadG
MGTKEDMCFGAGQEGQTLVEFALVFPILLLFVLAIIQLALVYSAKIILNYAAFSSARSFIVYQEHKKAEMAARLICLPISSRPTNMIGSAWH